MNFLKIKKYLKDKPDYRVQQVKKWIFQDLITSWDKATSLPLKLREELAKNFSLKIKAQTFVSKNKKTIKALFSLKDDLKIESVLMRYKERNTICVSSQVGCPLNCSFCATGQLGFKRNLTISEIINQVLFFARLLKEKNDKVTNIVFMGMGEAFLNYDNVIQAINILNDEDGFNLGIRSFSISTAGIIPGIKKLIKEEKQINLAVSLNAPNNDLRSKLMPINKKYPLEELLKVIDEYTQKTRRRVMFEYIMIEGVNDQEKHAKQLGKIAKNRLCLVNLIPYNSTNTNFQRSTKEQIEKFRKILEARGVIVTKRYSFGSNISAACGQLAGKK